MAITLCHLGRDALTLGTRALGLSLCHPELSMRLLMQNKMNFKLLEGKVNSIVARFGERMQRNEAIRVP